MQKGNRCGFLELGEETNKQTDEVWMAFLSLLYFAKLMRETKS
jgi:hypothetical protein